MQAAVAAAEQLDKAGQHQQELEQQQHPVKQPGMDGQQLLEKVGGPLFKKIKPEDDASAIIAGPTGVKNSKGIIPGLGPTTTAAVKGLPGVHAAVAVKAEPVDSTSEQQHVVAVIADIKQEQQRVAASVEQEVKQEDQEAVELQQLLAGKGSTHMSRENSELALGVSSDYEPQVGRYWCFSSALLSTVVLPLKALVCSSVTRMLVASKGGFSGCWSRYSARHVSPISSL